MDFNYAPEAADSFKKSADTNEFNPSQPQDEQKNLLDFLDHEKGSIDDAQRTTTHETYNDDNSEDDDLANFGATNAMDDFERESRSTSQAPISASDTIYDFNQAKRIDSGKPEPDDDVVCKRTPTKVEENVTSNETNLMDSYSSDETNTDDDFLQKTKEKRPPALDNLHFASDELSHKTDSPVPAESVLSEETKEATQKHPAPPSPKVAEPLISFETTASKITNIAQPQERISLVTEKPSEIGPKDFFSKYGLDTWFRPECLNPTVEAFIYWRDPKLSGIIFGSGLVLLLSLAYFSFISVVANTGLGILTCSIVFRIYKDILQAVQKSPQTHPYSVFLHQDIKLPQEKVHELVDTLTLHINACIGELRRLFLVEDMIESLKFASVLWVLTYVGSWFNGLTLVILAFVSLFTLPKVYENNKVQIDQNLALVRFKLEELTNKIKDALPAPLRRKLPEKKE